MSAGAEIMDEPGAAGELDPAFQPPSRAVLASFLGELSKALSLEKMPLRDFVREAWRIVEPSRPMMENYHIDLVCEHLDAVTAGQITRLVINMPPRNMKSLIVSTFWPTHTWTVDPTKRFIGASYSHSLSVKHNMDRRQIIESDWYQGKWGSAVVLRDDQNLKNDFQNTLRGHMIATSVGGSITGKGGDIVIVDDLVNPLEAESKAHRDNALDFYRGTLSTRLDDKKRGAIVVIEQRLHAQDLSSDLLKQGDWVHLCLPAEAPARTVLTYPLSKRTKVREMGEVLWPEREDKPTLDKQSTAMGSRKYQAQYQQDPSADQGNIFKRHYWQFYDNLPKHLDEIAMSWDMTFKKTDDSDFVAGGVWGRKGADRYLIDLYYGQMAFSETCKAFVSACKKHPKARRKLIEEAANGAAVIDHLGNIIQGIIAVKPEGGKVARAHACEHLAEAGNIHLPSPTIAPWIDAYIDECADFPDVPHDDRVDQMTQMLTYWDGKKGSSNIMSVGVIEYGDGDDD